MRNLAYKPRWEDAITSRDELDLPAIISAMRRAKAALQSALGDKSRQDWDDLAQTHDDLGDRIAEIDNVLDREGVDPWTR